MRRWLAMALAAGLLAVGLSGCVMEATSEKPVIYLYPQEETRVSVQLDFDGDLTSTYPAYEAGTGRQYYCLFWEGISDAEYDFSTGFCVSGEKTAAFLEEALAQLGLTEKEANEFIIYWLPRMEHNPYNLISFQTEAYTDSVELTIDPAPDTLIRVFMAWQGLDQPVEVEPQTFTAPERTGFTAVEWGGTEVAR